MRIEEAKIGFWKTARKVVFFLVTSANRSSCYLFMASTFVASRGRGGGDVYNQQLEMTI
jgi:hypothetical protein